MTEISQHDNKRLLELQAMYIATPNDSKIKSLFWNKIYTTCKKIVYHEKYVKGFYLDIDDVYDKSMTATEKIMKRYTKYKNYRIEKNFISACYFATIQSLYYRHTREIKFINYGDYKTLEIILNNNTSYQKYI